MDQALNDIMQFEHVIEVHEDGSITEPKGIWAPELFEDEIISKDWRFFTKGYSGQDSYSGPIMHNSEYIGGALERDIRETPGIYVAVVSYYSADNEEIDAEGWAVLTYIGESNG